MGVIRFLFELSKIKMIPRADSAVSGLTMIG